MGQMKEAEKRMSAEGMGFKESCQSIRETIETTKLCSLLLECHSEFEKEEGAVGRHSEMKANIQLAYRHLEDARMRFGKAIQAFDGGTSCYPK